jgi:hypothetical protein
VTPMTRRGRGRPSGKVPFLRSDRRFEVAVYVAARANGMATYMAGRSALILLRSVAPITNASLTADINIASTINYVSQDRPDKNVEHLITHAEEAMNHAAGADYLWVVNSASHFGALARCIAAGKMAGADISLQGLVALGWRDVLTKIWHRLEPALQSNLPPFDGVLRPATKRRIAKR